jgi:hypothetical protein
MWPVNHKKQDLPKDKASNAGGRNWMNGIALREKRVYNPRNL